MRRGNGMRRLIKEMAVWRWDALVDQRDGGAAMGCAGQSKRRRRGDEMHPPTKRWWRGNEMHQPNEEVSSMEHHIRKEETASSRNGAGIEQEL